LLLLFGIFAGVALLLASVGIYGVLAYLTSQRVPEFGVRMALGATARDVMRLVLRQSVSMIAAGVVIGAAGAWGAGRLLARVVDGMRPADLSTGTVMTLVLVAAAMLATAVPARRASRVDALASLRQE
jgi:ABC-type antimicrobial peptide transport system permease subunit